MYQMTCQYRIGCEVEGLGCLSNYGTTFQMLAFEKVQTTITEATTRFEMPQKGEN